MLNTIIKQNYFQYEDRIFQPKKGIAMGSPISGFIAEIYLQQLENIDIKHWFDSKETIIYKSYVDYILIMYDQQKTDEHMILHKINGVNKNLQFRMSTESNNTINYLDLLVYSSRNINIGIYRKPTEMGTVIHLASNHPLEQNISAFYYYINRFITLPIMEQSKQKEWETILAIARNNVYPITMIQGLIAKLIRKKKQKQTQQQQEATVTRNKWIAFVYFIHSFILHSVNPSKVT
jgi:hypothetical protein